MFTNGWPPQKDGADSFKRVLGGRLKAPDLHEQLTDAEAYSQHQRPDRPEHARAN